MISGLGVFVILLIPFLFSAHPTAIKFKPVFGGLLIQFCFAFLILRTQPGFDLFSFLGDRISEFLDHVKVGAVFVFGDKYLDHQFAFAILPVIVYFSAVITILFHLGVLQAIIQKIGWLMQKMLGTTAAESLVASANIFVGQIEAPLMIRPFIGILTNSELHAVLTSGFATIAGSVLAVYVEMGVPARHLLSASVMAAPAALALSKLMYPETKVSKTDAASVSQIKLTTYSNFIEAAGAGAMSSIAIVGAIAVNLIAFISLLTFINLTLTWLGQQACLSFDITIELCLSYLLWPFTFLIGIDSRDCLQVAELIGVKIILNEFIAFSRFEVIKKNLELYKSLNDTSYVRQGRDLYFPASNTTLTGGIVFEDRSLALATYALSGFSNISSMGMQIGAFSVMAPQRRGAIVKLVLRAMICGALANMLTASVAGIFYQPTGRGL